jgi:hypothetical protein
VSASSSSNVAAEKIAKKGIPMLTGYWKKSTVTEVDCVAYHAVGWLSGVVESSILDLEFSTVDNTTIVFFESHRWAWPTSQQVSCLYSELP